MEGWIKIQRMACEIHCNPSCILHETSCRSFVPGRKKWRFRHDPNIFSTNFCRFSNLTSNNKKIINKVILLFGGWWCIRRWSRRHFSLPAFVVQSRTTPTGGFFTHFSRSIIFPFLFSGRQRWHDGMFQTIENDKNSHHPDRLIKKKKRKGQKLKTHPKDRHCAGTKWLELAWLPSYFINQKEQKKKENDDYCYFRIVLKS